MGRYVIRRLLQMIPVIIGTTFLIFTMVFALGDPIAGRCGDRPCPPEYVAAMTEKYNLDDPLPVQYVKYMGNLAKGDFGEQLNGTKILERIGQVYPTTLKLATIAIGFEVLVGIAFGLVAAIRRGVIDKALLAFTLAVISIPIFVIGSVSQWFIGVELRWLPATALGGTWHQLLLPGLVLGSLSLAFVSRLTRTSLIENFRADYVRTAVAKGLPRRRVIGVHAMRNSLIPVITFIGADFGALLGGAIVTEGIFGIDGVGGMLFRGIRGHEGAVVTGVVTLLVLVYLLMNLIVDLMYAALDPRIRYD